MAWMGAWDRRDTPGSASWRPKPSITRRPVRRRRRATVRAFPPGAGRRGCAGARRYCASAVAPDGRQQREPVTTPDPEVLLENRPGFAFREQALYPVIDKLAPVPAAADRQWHRQPERTLASLCHVVLAVTELSELPAAHCQLCHDPVAQPDVEGSGSGSAGAHRTASASARVSTITRAPRGTAIRS